MIKLLRHTLALLKICIQVLFTRGNGKKNRDYGSSIFYKYAKETIKIGNLNIISSGLENIHYEKDQSYIIISNHTNYFDIPIAIYIFEGKLRFLVKKEMRKIPFWGSAMAKSEFIFIDRHNRKSAIKSLNSAKKLLKDGIRLLIYPEGTRSRTGKLQQFKKGAFQLAKQVDAKIIPMAIIGLEPGEVPKNKTIHVNIGKVIDAKHFDSADELKDYSWDIMKSLIETSSN